MEEVLFSKLRSRVAHAKFLVFNGDIIDFSLQSYAQAFRDAAAFFKALCATKMFDELIYVPGNHDHVAWEIVQQQVSVIHRITAGRPAKRYPYLRPVLLELGTSTLTLPNVRGSYGDVFLKGLFQDGSGKTLPGMPIAMVFPNLFIRVPGNPTRPILVTHGHFFCLPWVVITEVFPKGLELDKGMPLEELEQVNSPLTELRWTALGQAGPLTDLVRQIYNECTVGDTRPLESCIDELCEHLDREVFAYRSYDPREWTSNAGIKALRTLLVSLAQRAVAASAAHKGAHLFIEGDENKACINKYIGLSRGQYATVCEDAGVGIPSALIFGHTSADSPRAQRDHRLTAVRIHLSGAGLQFWRIHARRRRCRWLGAGHRW